MSKSHSFSIYLLKIGFDENNSLKDDHNLKLKSAINLPPEAKILILDNVPKTPWWRNYFGISDNLIQVSKGALIFLPAGGRYFALSFGHVQHYLKNSCYEYDFGIRVTLNSVNPKRLKSTDTVDPSASRRKRTQIPFESDLTYFDFDKDSTIMKRLTGKVKDEYKNLFKHVTGASNLCISSDVNPTGLSAICERLLEIYEKDDYKLAFPNIHNIEPVKDPEAIDQLNEKLLQAFKNKEQNLSLMVPDIINYSDGIYASFTGVGASLLYDDVSMPRYHEYLESNGVNFSAVNIDTFKKHHLCLADENNESREIFEIFECMVFDTILNGDTQSYHLFEGNWYKVEQSYTLKLNGYLDPCFDDCNLLAYDHGTEGAYNRDVAKVDERFICLDEEDISPVGQTQVEPCDLYTVANGKAIYYHVKVSTRSSQLSHLFNQGVNAIELIKLESQSRDKMKRLIKDRLKGNDEPAYCSPIDEEKHKVVYAIVTHKDRNMKSANLPLFSRISLMRSIKSLKLMNVDMACCFVDDNSEKKPGKNKKRKSKK